MPKPRKKLKHLEVEYLPDKSKRPTASDDLVGKFMVGISTAFITALISQAISNQINWAVVIVVTAIAFMVLAIYQSRQR